MSSLLILFSVLLIIVCSVILIKSNYHSDRIEKYDKPSTEAAIIIPFADLSPEEKRTVQLTQYLEILSTYDKPVTIIIAEQLYPKTKFNKGRLLNSTIDFMRKTEEFKNIDYLIFNDVDMIPSKDLFDQYFKTLQIRSFISPKNKVHEINYANNKYPLAGGIFGIQPETFIKVNGFPNNFWGWGGEDNVLEKRITDKNNLDFTRIDKGEYTSTDMIRNKNGSTSKYEYLNSKTLYGDHMEFKRNSKGEIKVKTKENAIQDNDWMINGFNTVEYKIVDILKESDNKKLKIHRFVFDLS